ncbi:MAG TPA: hypothetical protein DHV22_11490 [Xanthomarina gelatinilytica]|uniref:Uncharacterized protein n=1 Tax=Xanthomarina gelatinilytica TaxID=1137281 RepID=A0A3D6BSF9_9FLAO|nr:hypothetical protein [Xanthomarina gelatinilytica]
MKLFNELNNANFELYAAKHYVNHQCLSPEEFYEDLARFKYVVRLLRRYRESGNIQERLLLNHIITIYNVFEIPAANRMMFHRVDIDLWPALKTFLVYLNFLPENLHRNINIDLYIAKKLKDL